MAVYHHFLLKALQYAYVLFHNVRPHLGLPYFRRFSRRPSPIGLQCSVLSHNKDYNNVRVRQRYLFLSQSLNTNCNKIFLQKILEEHAVRSFCSREGEGQSFFVPTEGRVSPFSIKLLQMLYAMLRRGSYVQ